MSWNICMEIDVGNGNMENLDVLDENYTYNVAPMYYEAIGEYGISELDGMIGEKAYPILKKAVEEMEGNSEKYKAMNPENGWGDYEGALDLLKKMKKSAFNCP